MEHGGDRQEQLLPDPFNVLDAEAVPTLYHIGEVQINVNQTEKLLEWWVVLPPFPEMGILVLYELPYQISALTFLNSGQREGKQFVC
jgi:hypothetical protein